MNYLAHLFLSGDDKGMIIGNLIADHVKGKAIFNYPEPIMKGIILHRKIDFFTDSHQLVLLSKSRFIGKYGKYSGVLTDMFYDHFLSAGWSEYSTESLDDYSERMYSFLLTNSEILPEATRIMLNFMAEHNWLKLYGTLDGLSRALVGMTRRWSLPVDLSLSITDLENNYDKFKSDFNLFFPELMKYSEEQKIIINENDKEIV